MPAPAAEAEAAAAAADEKKAAEERQLELAEQNTKLAEKVEGMATAVAGIAETLASRPATAPVAAAQPAQQLLTDAQVWKLVKDGDATQEQALAYIAERTKLEARAEARREAQAALAEAGRGAANQRVLNAIAEYKKAIPALGVRGSPEFNEVANVYLTLVREEGYAETTATELQALREVYGRDPSKKREETEVRDRTKERATRGAETSSPGIARTPAPRRSRGSGEADPDLPSEHKQYVQRMINIGQYRGWDDPRAQKYVERAKAIAERKARSA